MARFDALVVGAGPAGSTTARELAAAGARVLVVDRATFPRYKACGGGIPLRTERLLPFPIDSVVEDSVHLLDVSLRGRHASLRIMTIEEICHLIADHEQTHVDEIRRLVS